MTSETLHGSATPPYNAVRMRRYLLTAIGALAFAVGLGWVTDGLAIGWWGPGHASPGPSYRWGLFLVGGLAAFFLIATTVARVRFRAWRGAVRDLLGVVLAVVLTPTGLAWLGDGLGSDPVQIAQASAGALLLCTAGVAFWRGLVASKEEVSPREVPEHRLVPPAVLEQATVLVASSGPIPPGGAPRALLYSIGAMPNLGLVISVDDGEKGSRGGWSGVDDHLDVIDRHRPRSAQVRVIPRPKVEHLKVTKNEVPNIEKLSEEMKGLLGNADLERVVVDVTGGNVPQTLVLYDVARHLGLTTLYVVAEPPSVLGGGRGQSESLATVEIERRMVLLADEDRRALGLQFLQVLESRTEVEDSDELASTDE